MATIPVPSKWIDYLRQQPETGMDYHVVRVTLHDGRRYEQVAIRGGFIVQVRGYEQVPFSEADITEIKVNHKKWKFHEGH
jgi:hypothetical protein